MTKQDILKAIEHGESVWVVFNEYSYENDSVKEIDWMKVEGVELHDNYLQYFNGKNLRGHRYELIFKTKAEAEHYLHHANVSRTEHLSFLTWEEFLKDEEFSFLRKDGLECCLFKSDEETIELECPDLLQSWDLTEANFYKAYDECVRLFKEEV